MLNLNDDDLQKSTQEAQNNTQEPMLYQLTRNKEIPLWETHYPYIERFMILQECKCMK